MKRTVPKSLAAFVLVVTLLVSTVWAATVIVEDQFTRAADAALTAHTPTPTGTGWTQVYLSGTAVITVIAATDTATGGNGATSSDGQYCSVQPDPTVAEYDVQATMAAILVFTGNRGWGMFARRTDNSNLYAVQILPNDATPATLKLFKRVAGVNTELGSSDQVIANGDIIKFEVRDATKKVFQNGIERISTTDNALTAAGTWGWGIGAFPALTDSVRIKEWQIDNFTCTEVSAAAPAPPPRRIIITSNRKPWGGARVWPAVARWFGKRLSFSETSRTVR